MAFKNIVTITVNPAIDATVWVDENDFTEPVQCRQRHDYPGGKAINVSRVLNSLSVENLAICIAGQDNADRFEGLLKAENDTIDIDMICQRGAIRENLSVVFPDGRLLKINFKGFELERKSLFGLKDRISRLCDSDTLAVFAGSLPMGMSKSEYLDLIFLANSKGAKIALDNSFFTAPEIKKIAPFIIKPNKYELAGMYGKATLEADEIIAAAKDLSQAVENVLVSMGAEGMIGAFDEGIYSALPPTVKVKSTVGAGDSSLAGFIAAIGRGSGKTEALRFAAGCGTASVEIDGTGVITAADAANIGNKVNVSALS